MARFALGLRPFVPRLRAAAPLLAAGAVWMAAASAAAQQLDVMPVSGPSDLHRLGLTVQQTSMGWTGGWGSPRTVAGVAPAAPLRIELTKPVSVTGADLYRLACRACHKSDGSGAPPEINTLVDPVQGTSLVLWERRMKQAGRPIDRAFDAQIVAGAKKDLLTRLTQGGQKMPPFGYLRPDEITALIGYMETIADVPGASGTRPVVESVMRIGEHLVMGTCHTCHDATGPWPGPEQLLDNTVPSLASIVERDTPGDFIRKVRHGAPIVMGIAQVSYRGRMPVFDYLTDDEVAAAYAYLTAYPPR